MVTTADKRTASPDNDAENSLPLLPVAEVEKCVKATIRQAASPVVREAMWRAYKQAVPAATVTVSPDGAMPWEGRGMKVLSSHEATRDVCLAMLAEVPDNAERARLQNIMADELERIGEDTEARPRCMHCGRPFQPANRRQRYCKPAHRTAAYEARRELQAAGA
jgi:hypothetical protein